MRRFPARAASSGLGTLPPPWRWRMNVLNGDTTVTSGGGNITFDQTIDSPGHKNLTLTVGTEDQTGQPPEPVPGVGFVPLLDQQTRQSPQKLNQLISALNQLKVPTADVIDILKELHRAGKLHAELITE